jgi:hypothetical protein
MGGGGKRRLLYALAHPETWGDEPPPWSKKALARLAGLQEKNAVGRHVEILRRAGVIVREHGTYRVNESSTLLGPIRDLTDELERLAPRQVPPSRGGR